MIQTSSTLRPPTSKLASFAFSVSFSATLLGVLGVTPYPKMLLFPITTPSGIFEFSLLETRYKIPLGDWVYYVLAIFPMIAGLLGILLGRVALWRVCKPEVSKSGETRAVFATFIGLFAFCLGLVSTFVIFIWPKLEVKI